MDFDMELELNREWIYDEDGEVIGETNYVISYANFYDLFGQLSLKLQDGGVSPDEFLKIYEPEVDGELIYQEALKQDLLIEDLGVFIY